MRGSSPSSVGADGTIYIGSDAGILFAINPDGSQKWQFATGSLVVSGPAIATDGTIYVGSFDHNFYAINPDGTQKWAFSTGAPIDASAAISADGTVYVGSTNNNFYAINPDGSLKWTFATGGAIGQAPAIGADGTIYIGSNDGNLYALGNTTSAITALGPAGVWVGLKNSDDQGTQFDLRAEVYLNSTLIDSGQTLCVTDITRNPANATNANIPIGPISSTSFNSGDVLSLKLLARIGTNPNGSKCSGPGGSHNNATGLRLYYDATNRASHLGNVITGVPSDLFLHSNGNACANAQSTGVTNRFLDGTNPSASAAKCLDSGSVNFANGNPWSTINSWSITLP